MKKPKPLFISCLLCLMICQFHAFSQSYFSSKEEVVNYLEGSWDLEAISWMGGVTNLPSEWFIDSTTHCYEFVLTDVDSLPLLCKSFVNGQLHEEQLIEVEYEDDDGFPGPWRLKNLPEHLSSYTAIMEDTPYFYELSDNTMHLFQMAFDGLSYGLTRSSVNKTEEALKNKNLTLFPNPVSGDQIWYRLVDGRSITEIRLFDFAGKEYPYTFHNTQEGSIELKNLGAGSYIVELRDNLGNVCREKIIKPR